MLITLLPRRPHGDLLRQIEERLLPQRPVRLHDADQSLPLDDKDASAAIRRERQVDRVVQSAGDLDELNLRVAGEIAAEQSRSTCFALSSRCPILRQTWHHGPGEPSTGHADEEDSDRKHVESWQSQLL